MSKVQRALPVLKAACVSGLYVPNLALRPLELLYTFACTDGQSQIGDSSSPQLSGNAGMLLCEVNTWSPHCCTVEKANAPCCNARKLSKWHESGSMDFTRKEWLNICLKDLILAAAEKWRYFRPLAIATIILPSHYAHCLMLLECFITELQPVITELMVG